MLSGGSAINYGLWVRAPACEYDQWGELAGDESWGWKGMLPYFIKVCFSSHPIFFLLIPIAYRNIHLLQRNSQPRPPWNFWTYLNSWYQSLSCQPTISALQKNLHLTQNMGCALNPDGNSGSVKGHSECSKTGRTGQPASVAYEVAQCKNVTILTSTLVHKILFDTSNT